MDRANKEMEMVDEKSGMLAPETHATLPPLPPNIQQPIMPIHQFHAGLAPIMNCPQNFLVPYFNGQWFYMVPSYAVPPMAPYVPMADARSEPQHQNDQSGMYVKKPLNAFMIYRKEQRPKVVAELGNPDCGVVNKVIGERWKSLSKQEQEKYYEEAERERQRHYELHPEWSAANNYGKKRKRIRRKSLVVSEEVEI